MECSATITVTPKDEAQAKRLLQLLTIESGEGESSRGSFRARKDVASIVIDVSASDSVALRATLVAATKILTVHEKVNE